jgi:hypothetical protein
MDRRLSMRRRTKRLHFETLEPRWALDSALGLLAEGVAAEGLAVQVRLETVDAAGQPIETIGAGQPFTLKVYVQDVREQPQGVFATYVDVSYPAGLVRGTGEIAFGDAYFNGKSGADDAAGEIHALGAFSGLTPGDGGERLLASVPFVAYESGRGEFQVTPALERGYETLVYGWDVSVAAFRVGCVGKPLEVTGEWTEGAVAADPVVELPPPVQVPPDGGVAVQVRLVAVDQAGLTIATAAVGQPFTVDVYVRDLRPVSQGVFAAYVDMAYAPEIVAADGEPAFGEAFPNGRSGESASEGLAHKLGAFAGIETLGNSERLLARVPFVAHTAGTARFAVTPADEYGYEVLVYGWDVFVDASRVEWVGTQITVVAGDDGAFGATLGGPGEDDFASFRLLATDQALSADSWSWDTDALSAGMAADELVLSGAGARQPQAAEGADGETRLWWPLVWYPVPVRESQGSSRTQVRRGSAEKADADADSGLAWDGDSPLPASIPAELLI